MYLLEKQIMNEETSHDIFIFFLLKIKFIQNQFPKINTDFKSPTFDNVLSRNVFKNVLSTAIPQTQIQHTKANLA